MDEVTATLQILLMPEGLGLAVLGYLIGCVGGAMIGIGGAMTTALVIPFTLVMPPEHAMIILIGVYAGVSYAASIPAILINTPGAPSSAASAFDGYPMARTGEATTAISISATASAFGGLIGGIGLLVALPVLNRLAVLFGSPEFLMFGVFGLASIVAASQSGLTKGFIAGILGTLLATIGASLLDARPRFTFGTSQLYDGIDLVATMIGMFAFAEMVRISHHTDSISGRLTQAGSWLRGMWWTVREWKAVLRGSGLGIAVGLVPGEGATVATFMSYITEKQLSREPERFGKGHPAGIAGPEAANNAVIAGALVPTLSFGIPGSVATALLLTALSLQGVRPGPELIQENAVVLYTIVGSLLVSAVLTLVVGIVISRPLAYLTAIPVPMLVPVVSLMSLVGIYASNFTYSHVWMALGAGVLGYAFVRLNYPIVAFLLGFIVGPLAEENFMRSYQITGGQLYEIFQRPICAILLVLTLLVILRPLLSVRRSGAG